MVGALRRWASRSCVAAAAACLLLSLAAPSSGAQDELAPRPQAFRGEASSLVASVEVDRDALLPVPELFRFIALDGNGSYGSSSQQARASLLYPGNGLILGPNLVCGTFGEQFPPELKPIFDTCLQYQYPLTVFADSFEPDGTTEGALTLGTPSDPVSGHAVRASAHAGEDATTTDAVMHDLRVLGLPALGPVALPIPGLELDASLLTIDAATSRTDQRIVDGTLVVEAASTVSGVRMIGGLVRIGSMRSLSRVTDAADGTQTSEASFEVSGVTVGGVPAEITEEGLVLGSPAGGLGPIVQQLQTSVNGLLEALGVRVSLLGVEETIDEETAAVASAPGILLELGTDVRGLPTVPGPLGDIDLNGLYTGTIRLGSTAAMGTAASFDDSFVVPPLPVPDVAGGFSDPVLAPDTGSGLDLPAPAAAPPAEEAAPEDGPRLARSIVDLFGGRVALLYLSFTLAALALCLSPRFLTPARLPAARA